MLFYVLQGEWNRKFWELESFSEKAELFTEKVEPAATKVESSGSNREQLTSKEDLAAIKVE